MKKKYILSLVSLVLLAGCNDKAVDPSIILPKGTPLIALANYAVDHQDTVEVVAGPQLIAAALGEGKKDIVVGPINLGALRYNAGNEAYGLYRTIVWDNLYLVSRTEITDFYSLEGKNITSFGKGGTPQIVFDIILNSMGITANVTYVNDVITAHSMFSEKKADYVISAEPNLTTLNKAEAFTYSLKDAWEATTGLSSYPQSAIFVKKEKYEELKPALKEIDQAYEKIATNVQETAKNASQFLEMPLAKLEEAIPNCGYKTFDDENHMVNEYFRLLLEMEMGNTIGGKLPNEEFYLKK